MLVAWSACGPEPTETRTVALSVAVEKGEQAAPPPEVSGHGKHAGGEVLQALEEEVFPTETHQWPAPDPRTIPQLDDELRQAELQWRSQHNTTVYLRQAARTSVAAMQLKIDRIDAFENADFSRVDTLVHVTAEGVFRKLPSSTAIISSVIVLGGSTGARGYHVSHQPQFVRGERYVVFLPVGHSDVVQGLSESHVLHVLGQTLIGPSKEELAKADFDALVAQLGEDL